MKKLVIFISGRGSNMEAIIRECRSGILKNIAEPILIFSDKAEAAGLQIAQQAGISTETLSAKGKKRASFDKEVIGLLEKYSFDFIVLAGYMRILSRQFVEKFSGKIINIHPADTRKHQGLHAYKWAFDNKLRETKITVHYVDAGIDTGKIIGQKSVNLQGASSLQEVEKLGLAAEHRFYPQMIKRLCE